MGPIASRGGALAFPFYRLRVGFGPPRALRCASRFEPERRRVNGLRNFFHASPRTLQRRRRRRRQEREQIESELFSIARAFPLLCCSCCNVPCAVEMETGSGRDVDAKGVSGYSRTKGNATMGVGGESESQFGKNIQGRVIFV